MSGQNAMLPWAVHIASDRYDPDFVRRVGVVGLIGEGMSLRLTVNSLSEVSRLSSWMRRVADATVGALRMDAPGHRIL